MSRVIYAMRYLLAAAGPELRDPPQRERKRADGKNGRKQMSSISTRHACKRALFTLGVHAGNGVASKRCCRVFALRVRNFSSGAGARAIKLSKTRRALFGGFGFHRYSSPPGRRKLRARNIYFARNCADVTHAERKDIKPIALYMRARALRTVFPGYKVRWNCVYICAYIAAARARGICTKSTWNLSF